MLQWFTLLLATVVSATGVLFVKPSNDTPCPQLPCYTLEHYAQSWQLYLTSNTIVQFLPGEHVLEEDWGVLAVENVSNLTLIGSDSMVYNSSPLGIPTATSRVSCRRGKTMFSLYNVTELFIARLTFSECGQGFVTLYLHEVSNLVLESVTIQNSTGTGLIGNNLRKSLIRHSTFMFNQASSDCCGNILLLYDKCSETFTVNITSSWILFGHGTTKFGCVGGLSLQVKEFCYNVRVHIYNTTLKENMGGNMFVLLNGIANSIFTIADSYFEGGYTSNPGGGMLLITTSQHFQNNRVYINNTEFVGNYADFGGAIAVYPCTGNELYIYGSKFRNNAARGDGGHIAIYLFCKNMTITINNSLFEDGKATYGGGGGVALNGQHNALLCTPNGNHIYISNTRFAGNYAKLFGGAVSQVGCAFAELNIDQSKFYNNTDPTNGGHIDLQLLSLDNMLFIIINNSHFESGKAIELGGGISVSGSGCTSVNNNTHLSVHIMNSKVYQNVGGGMAVNFNHSCFASHAVYINNTEFVGNHALLGGAISIHPSTSTELHINGSNFHSNVAGNGGHISISLGYYRCVNITITINNSLFEDGNATDGCGGGIAVPWDCSDFQCTNGSRMYISNTQFVGNYANLFGGAVSLLGCIGIELYINKSKFYNNTATFGGHITLFLNSDHIQFIVLNSNHFESGKARLGGGISVLANESCTSVSSTIRKSVYIMNSKIYQHIAETGGGIGIQFDHNCFAFNVLVHNVSLSRNSASLGGSIGLLNNCTAGNSITISNTTVEFGNASDAGGGMIFVAMTSEVCSSSMINIKPTTFTIVDSIFQYNTAVELGGGGLSIAFNSTEYYCCNVEVSIMNVTFFNNKAGVLPVSVDETTGGGGNIQIHDNSGNNSVRIHSCLIEGGVAGIGGGILLSRYPASNPFHENSEFEGIFVSSTRFVCNQGAGASLQAQGGDPKTRLKLSTATIPNKLTITDTTLDGACTNSTNVVIIGFGFDYPFLPAGYNVVFINVSFRGYSTNLSSPLYSQQLSDFSLDDQFILKPTAKPHPGVLLSFVPNATFIDCELFESTADSALYAAGTNVIFGGNITFRDNIATRGGGLMLIENSVMYLTPNTHILFSHNHATYVGGAIYAQSVDAESNSRCFYQFDEVDQTNSDLNIQVNFKNNTAHFAGSALYGGSVDHCFFTPYETIRNISFDFIFKVLNTDEDPSAISSDPYRVCFCSESIPACNDQLWHMYTYPGALLHVQAVVVGQKDGIVPGVVRATPANTSAVLSDLQQSQATGKSCTTLNYTVFTLHTVETIIIVSETTPGRKTQELMMNVTLLPCPWGFNLTGAPPKCGCADELRNHNIDTCNITTQTIGRPPPLWIGYYHSDNNSEPPVEGVLVHDHCPFDYCKPEQLSIQLNDSDKQCAFNHSGILCGACQPGLSLALGTSRCLKCSNKYLMLLFAFAAAGLALVFLLTLTNMTVSEGTINGLIFYANIIHINRAIFFPNESSGVNKIILNILSTFISWINLDLGIETCFYNGMDMYTKAWLQFLFPIYIWTIVGVVIVSSHYSTTAAKLFRRHAVKVLATLFLLSFAKLQRTIITALSFTFLTYPDGTKTVWLYDSNIKYLHGKHIPLFIAALLALLFLLIPYTLVLFFIQCLAKLDCRIFFWVRKLKPLFDAYTGPYKDRYRFWTGFLLIVRTILFLIFTLGNPGLNLAAISVTSTCLAFSPAVYKKVWLTLLEYSLLFNLSTVSVATFYCRYTQFSGNQAVVVYISVGTALVTFFGIMAYHLYQCTINSRAWKNISDQVTQRSSDRELVNIVAESSDEEEKEEPSHAEIRPLMLQFDENRVPVLVYDD